MSAEETFTNMNLPKYQFAIDKITEKIGILWTLYVCMYSITGITTTEVKV